MLAVQKSYSLGDQYGQESLTRTVVRSSRSETSVYQDLPGRKSVAELHAEFLVLAQVQTALRDEVWRGIWRKTRKCVARPGNSTYGSPAMVGNYGSIGQSSTHPRFSDQIELCSPSRPSRMLPTEQPAGGSRKRKLSYHGPDEENKRAKLSLPIREVEPDTGLKRHLDSAVVERESKQTKRETGVAKQSTTSIGRSSSPEVGALIWSEVVDDILHVYVSRDCPLEHYRCLSKRLSGNGSVDPFTGLMFSLQLPADKPELWEEIASFFSPQRPWCKEAYCVARKYRLSMRDSLIENIIRDLVKEHRHAYEDYSSDWSVESDIERWD